MSRLSFAWFLAFNVAVAGCTGVLNAQTNATSHRFENNVRRY
jgi:hypothetical protein